VTLFLIFISALPCGLSQTEVVGLHTCVFDEKGWPLNQQFFLAARFETNPVVEMKLGHFHTLR
jgi:hypothetical protein